MGRSLETTMKITTEYRARLRALTEARAALDVAPIAGDAHELARGAAQRAFYDLEDLRAALRPDYVHRGAYVGWTGETGARPPFHRHIEPARQLRKAIRSGAYPLPRRELDAWDRAAIERLARSASTN
jgi:hypothetical protein